MDVIEKGQFEEGEEEESSVPDRSGDIEPILKYDKISNDVSSIFSADCASCLAVHAKFVCIGCKSGRTFVVDHLGNLNTNVVIPSHSLPVNQIAIDERGDHVATCSDDGKVLVSGLVSQENSVVIIMDRPVSSIAVDPGYYRSGSGRRIITGDDRLTLHEKNFFSRYKSTTLHEGEGIINNIQWRGRFIAWATTAGVRVYDIVAKRTISLIKREHRKGGDWERLRCQLYWRDDLTLVVGWGDEVKVCRVRKRYDIDVESRELPNYLVEILSLFTTEFIICGLGHLGDQLTILSTPYDGQEHPVLRTIEYHPESYIETSLAEWPLRDYTTFKPNDFHLVCLPEENCFFLVSPQCVVVAKPRDAEDHMQWLLDHERFEDALREVSTASGRKLRKYNRISVGRAYIDYLLDSGEYDRAATICIDVLGKDRLLWEEEFAKFSARKQLRAICNLLPVDSSGQLNKSIYESVLLDFLHSDPDLFFSLIVKWPPNIYRAQLIIDETLKFLSTGLNDEHITLLNALAALYLNEGGYEKAMALYLKLQRSDVFNLIRRHRLYSFALGKIVELMELDPKQTVLLLTDNVELFPVESIVSKLSSYKNLLYIYLDALYQRDSRDLSRPYHNQLLHLYADCERSKLLRFLKSSDYYSISEALEVSKQNNFVPEIIYLLDRMGNNREALDLIVTKLADIDQAIDFCQRHDDRDLWDQLLEYTSDNPDFVLAILHNSGTRIDPKTLIERIRPRTEIPGLRNALVEILRDFSIQIELEESCQRVMVADCFLLQEKLVRLQSRGVNIDACRTCNTCQLRLVLPEEKRVTDVAVFKCNHIFHRRCLKDEMKCQVCSSGPS